jgi:hypothetical protein
MGPLDAVWHLLNLFGPAIGLGGIAAALAKLLWRRDLAGRPWHRLAGPAILACMAVTLAGLALTGHDGAMATYGAMVLASAATLWWAGFVRRG